MALNHLYKEFDKNRKLSEFCGWTPKETALLMQLERLKQRFILAQTNAVRFEGQIACYDKEIADLKRAVAERQKWYGGGKENANQTTKTF